MRREPCSSPAWSAIVASVAALVCAAALADEPTKPTATATEANPAAPAAGHSIHGEAFNDGPRQHATLMEGMGKIDFHVTSARAAQVQPFINQGVGQLHSFYYLEAERSFRQAAKIDPACVMAYWGMAMANINNAGRAKGFLKEVQKRAAAPAVKARLSPRETLYIDALAAFFKEGADDKARRHGWLTGLESVVQQFPGDLDARAWLAMVTWQNSYKDGIGSRQAVDELIEEVLRVEPMHNGAHHYRIHLWDGVKPSQAVKSAALFGKSAPGIAHSWHMGGHTYTGLKRYADAAYQQEASARVDHAYMFRDRVMPFEIHNYAHNNQWLATSLSHVGRAREAIAVARNLVEQPRDPDKNGPNDGGSAQREGRIRWSEVLVRYELWDDLIAATASGDLDWSDVPFERKEKFYSLGLAFAAKGDRARLGEQIAALKALADSEAKKNAPKEPRKDRPAPSDSVGIQPALAELEGHQKLLEGQPGPAFEHFAKATSMRSEALARSHLAAKNFGLAESTARSAVESRPNEVPPLAVAIEALQAVGKVKEAQDLYAKLEPLARRADPELPVFRRIAAIVASWESQGEWRRPKPSEAPADAESGDRTNLDALGPLTWAPNPAEPFRKNDTQGISWSLADHKGRNVVVLFFLGGKCAHCMQQLQTFGQAIDALKALNTDVVAVSTDDLDACKALKNNADGVKFPMPILADPMQDVFKSYRSRDDFEEQPLHGTFLIDAQGRVRYQRISADPFLDVDFIKAEAARINRVKF